MANGCCNKEKILRVATDLFYRKGYRATSLDEVLSASGVSKSNFYYHYKSKEHLGLAVLEERLCNFSRSLGKTLKDGNRQPKERLAAFFDNIAQEQLQVLNKGGCPFGNLSVEMSEHSDLFRCRIADVFRQLQEELAQCLQDGMGTGDFRDDLPVDDTALFLLATWQGMLVLTKTSKSLSPYLSVSKVFRQLLSNEPTAISDQLQTQ